MLYKSWKLVIVLFVSLPVVGQNFNPVPNSEKIVAELRQTSQATQSIQADFHEEKQVSFLKQPQKSTGVFYYKKEDQMRWEQKTPYSYVILINRDKLRVRDGAKEKDMSTANRMAGRIKDMMLGMVNGSFDKNSSFTTYCMENEESYLVVLTPVNKRMKNIYEKVNLTFSKKTQRLKELTFFEKNGDKSTMRFFNEKFNLAIDDQLFQKL
jgi:outer membrane lipoprotein-sorting protein